MEQQQIDLSNAIDLKCADCGKSTFTAVFVLKKISALLSPTGKATFAPVQVFECSNCHLVPEDFLSAFEG